MEPFDKELSRQLFKPNDAQQFQDLVKVLAISVRNLNNITNKICKMKSSITSMKPKDANKLDIAELDKSETYPEENQPREHRGDREKRANESIWSEIRHKLNRIAE